MSLPARIPVAIDTIGCTEKNNIIVTSIPASALTVFTVISGIINIAVKMIAIIIIERLILLIAHLLNVFLGFD
jgi:hypothetical protein